MRTKSLLITIETPSGKKFYDGWYPNEKAGYVGGHAKRYPKFKVTSEIVNRDPMQFLADGNLWENHHREHLEELHERC
jgi:hypothetical protein